MTSEISYLQVSHVSVAGHWIWLNLIGQLIKSITITAAIKGPFWAKKTSICKALGHFWDQTWAVSGLIRAGEDDGRLHFRKKRFLRVDFFLRGNFENLRRQDDSSWRKTMFAPWRHLRITLGVELWCLQVFFLAYFDQAELNLNVIDHCSWAWLKSIRTTIPFKPDQRRNLDQRIIICKPIGHILNPAWPVSGLTWPAEPDGIVHFAQKPVLRVDFFLRGNFQILRRQFDCAWWKTMDEPWRHPRFAMGEE